MRRAKWDRCTPEPRSDAIRPFAVHDATLRHCRTVQGLCIRHRSCPNAKSLVLLSCSLVAGHGGNDNGSPISPSSWQGIAVTDAIDRHSTLLSRGLRWFGKKRGKAQQLLSRDFPREDESRGE